MLRKRFKDVLLRLVTTQVAWPVLFAVALLCLVSILTLNTLPAVAGGSGPPGTLQQHPF